MSLTIDLAPETERLLREHAERRGIAVEDLVVNTLAEHVRASAPNNVPSLPAEESALLQQINEGLSQAEWGRYHQLIQLRQDERLNTEDQDELIGLSDRLDEMNVRRLEALLRLARIRGCSLPELMAQLGIQAG